jgi:hypothetical protein
VHVLTYCTRPMRSDQLYSDPSDVVLDITVGFGSYSVCDDSRVADPIKGGN